MNQIGLYISTILIAGIIGGVTSGILLKGRNLLNIEKKKKEAIQKQEEAKKEAERIKKETMMNVQKRKETIEQEKKSKEQRFKKTQEVLKNKERNQGKKEEKLKEEENKLKKLKEEIRKIKEEIKKTDNEYIEKLSKAINKKPQEIKEEILKKYENELEMDIAEKLSNKEEFLKENAKKEAEKAIVEVIQRMCSPTSVETRVVTVKVPKDYIKGQIVGKNAENIKLIEEELDVDIVFNDLPNTISISAFMLVRRRIAQRTIEKLVKTRENINKETVIIKMKEAEKDVDKELYEIGKKSLIKMGIKNENTDLCRTIGRLQYRTSYGQNIMKHSMEVGWVSMMLGNEIGLDAETCLISGFLHDLGKAIDQEQGVKDTHDQLTKELMEKFGFSEEKIHAAWTHHDASPQKTPEALIVKAADAVSASRPGARQESFDKYIERIKALEGTAISYEGVKSAYAISAGRELRVIVDTEKVKDEKLKEIAGDMAQKIEENITYPGQIKVNVIRRIKHTEITK